MLKRALTPLVLIFCVTRLYGVQTVLRIQPLMPIQSSMFGIKIGAFEPCFGMDMGFISAKDDYESIEWEKTEGGQEYKYYEKREKWNGSATIIIPRIGSRYYLPFGGASPYVSLSLFKSVPLVNASWEREYWYYDSTGAVTDHGREVEDMEDEKEAARDFLAFWGGTIGIGGEYFIKDNFSISGECDFNFFSFGGKYAYEYSGSSYRDRWEHELRAIVGFTSTRLFINFYFGDSKKEG